MVGYVCVVEGSLVVDNCYMAMQEGISNGNSSNGNSSNGNSSYNKSNSSNYSCEECKKGYGVYFGLCLPFDQISLNLNFTLPDCQNKQYLRDNQLTCLRGNNLTLQHCLTADFGQGNCLLC